MFWWGTRAYLHGQFGGAFCAPELHEGRCFSPSWLGRKASLTVSQIYSFWHCSDWMCCCSASTFLFLLLPAERNVFTKPLAKNLFPDKVKSCLWFSSRQLVVSVGAWGLCLSFEWCYKATKLCLKKGTVYICLLLKAFYPEYDFSEPWYSGDPLSSLEAEGEPGLQGVFSKPLIPLIFLFLVFIFGDFWPFETSSETCNFRPRGCGCSPYHAAMAGKGFCMMPSYKHSEFEKGCTATEYSWEQATWVHASWEYLLRLVI